MRTAFRAPAKETTVRAQAEGPGPNCPIKYSVDPSREKRDGCVRALRVLREKILLQRSKEEAAAAASAVSGSDRLRLATSKGKPVTGQQSAQLRQLLAIEAQTMRWLEKWHKENDRLSWFYTTLRNGLADPTYAPLFQAFHKDVAKLRFLRAPNQVGKSYAAAAEVYFYATGRHPFKQIEAKWANPAIEKTILIVTGSDKNREGVYQALWTLCPVGSIDWVSTHYDTRNMWGVRNPSIFFPETNTKIIFRSSNQDTDSLNSLTVDGIWIDEPPKAGTIDEIRRGGLARKAWVIMSFTPVGELGEDFTWLRDYVEGDEEWRSSEGAAGEPPRGDWHQYQIGIPDCPWFDKEELEERRKVFREEQAPQRLLGEWESAALDRAFTHFKEAGVLRTVIDKWAPELLSYAPKLQYAIGIDHGEKANTQVAVLVAYAPGDPKAPATIVAEYVSKTKTTTEEDAHGIVNMLASVGLTCSDVTLWVGDINTGGKEVKGEKLNMLLQRSLVEICKSRGEKPPGGHIRIPDKYAGSVETEERRMNAGFKERRLFVHSRCKTLTHSLRRYRGDGCAADKKLKHCLDAARYALQTVLDRIGVAVVYSREYAGRSLKVNLRAA